MVFGFGKKKKDQYTKRRIAVERDLKAELEALRTELDLLSSKMNVELKKGDGDRTTTLSRYPRRIVELKIQIDELERKLTGLSGR